MSRRKLPSAVKLARGTLRPCRDDPSGEPVATGEPKATRRLTGEALKFWKRVVPQLARMGIVKAIDSDALTVMAELHGMMQATLAELKRDVTDRPARLAYTAAHTAWLRLASAFGLTPADRAKLQIHSNDGDGEFEQLLKSRRDTFNGRDRRDRPFSES